MQETRMPEGMIQQEFFQEETDEKVTKKMDERLGSLVANKGHEFVRRVKIGRNEQCPCGSGVKFKKCCIHKVNSHE